MLNMWKCVSKKYLERKNNFNRTLKDLEIVPYVEIRNYAVKRGKIIERLAKKGLKVAQKGNTLFYLNLSKGCRICKEGKWFCPFIEYQCTRSCFFCPMSRKKPKNDVIFLENFPIETPEEIVNLTKKWKIKGVGISGGEPLCMFDKTLDIISKLRKNLGSEFYIWLYTNGDLASKENLIKLKKAGLNEIRFNLAARNYDLVPIIEARKIIDVISVETPVIPEDEYKLKSILLELKKLKVDYVNLHELMFFKYNLESLKKRGYKILNFSPKDFTLFYPVHGSEISALRIMEFAIDKKIGIPINFCSTYYKQFIQTPFKNKHISEIVKKPHETVTDSGYLKKIIIDEPYEKAVELFKILKNMGVEEDKIYFSKKMKRFELHPNLLQNIDIERFKIKMVLGLVSIDGKYNDIFEKSLN